MILIKNIVEEVIIPKTIRNNDEQFTMIIQHNYTRRYWVIDYMILSEHNLYYIFEFEVLDGMPKGEYTYYITPYNSGFEYTIDISNIYNTCVTSYTGYNEIASSGNSIAVSGNLIVVDANDEPGGCEKINILQSGLMRIKSEREVNPYINHRIYKGYEQGSRGNEE